MELLFKQRVFSWLDSYDIYNEQGEVEFVVKGKLNWGHRLVIYNAQGEQVGEIVEQVLTFLPKFKMIDHGVEIGDIEAEFHFFKPKYHLTCNDWKVEGDIWEWDYEVNSASNGLIMNVTKELFHFSDTYTLRIPDSQYALQCLMIVLAIDAAKCSRN